MKWQARRITAGSILFFKVYLIKCLVKVIKLTFDIYLHAKLRLYGISCVSSLTESRALKPASPCAILLRSPESLAKYANFFQLIQPLVGPRY